MKIIDIHTHGGFGINFNTATLSDVCEFAKKAKDFSVFGFCPTLATDSFENIRHQLSVFSAFRNSQNDDAKMLGVHLEAIFLNPEKAGIHNSTLLAKPTVDNFKLLVGEFQDVIKIVTLAPELDENSQLRDYLISNNIKVQAGHTVSKDVFKIDGTTHHFNAMPTLSHRDPSITLKAILDDNIYTEIIADGVHTSDEMLKLFFKSKNPDKIILVSDSLPIVHSNLDEIVFCGQTILKTGKNKDGKLAGSVMFVQDIVKYIVSRNILDETLAQKMVWDNPIAYLGLEKGDIE